MAKLRVGIVFGGRSGEHEVSLASAASIMAAVDPHKYHLVPVGITKEGRWLASGDPLGTLQRAASGTAPVESAGRSNNLVQPLEVIRGLDVVFPVLHGPYGEDGTVQGLLELAGVPYVGAGVAASAVGMDKALMKAVFQAHGLPIVRHRLLLRSEWEAHPHQVIAQVEGEFSYPCFVKPTNLGSSVGIAKAKHRGELVAALDDAARYDRKLLVEEAIEAREVECAILGNEEPAASLLGEVIPHREFYDYQAKYHDPRTELVIPMDLPQALAQEIRRLALRAFSAIDAAGMARVDFFLCRRTGAVYVDEINTIPGFTAVSMYPRLWEASGLPYPELIDRLLQLALERHKDRRRNAIAYQPPAIPEGAPVSQAGMG